MEINGFYYFAPLSSFKSKHKKMKESVDFIKIKDYEVININNMIPVPKEQMISGYWKRSAVFVLFCNGYNQPIFLS